MHPQVSWILSRQAALTIVLAIVAGLFVDANAAVSVLIGGSIGLIANLGYVLRALRMSSGSDPIKVYRAQAAGEGFKFVLTLAGFALVFLEYKDVAVLPLFLGYTSTFVIYWMALLKQR
ncbi:MAG TPA: ATP synthase subunit I [Azonexus sp.]